MAVMNDIAFFQAPTQYLSQICQKNSRKKKAFNCSGIEIASAARKIRSSCEETFERCQWNGEDFDCCKHFLHLETELGICYSINNVQTTNNSQPAAFIDLRSNRCTGPGSLRLDLKTTANVFIQSRSDVPNLNPKETDTIFVHSKLKTEHEVYLVVRETDNAHGVTKVDAKKRNCNFPWEGNAGYYSHYSYSACIVGCRRRAEMALCNCTRHLLPYRVENGKVCDINEIFCIKNETESLLTLQAPWATKESPMKCPCLSGCEDTQIDVIMRRDHDGVNAGSGVTSSIELKLLYLPSEKYERSVVRSGLDLV
ncbi:hypothetical protein Cfor_05274, partial [Coptotermes formosanus]